MRRLRLALPASLAGAALAGVAVTVAARGGAPAPAAVAPPPVSTATVVRTDLVSSVLTGGTLGYAPTRPIVNQLAGTYTWLPALGSRVRAGGALYRVDDLPVVLMRGRTPAWRPFAPGMTDGPDVAQLQANLIALGFAAGLLQAPTGHFDLLTEYAVERWQTANGYLPTGEIALGQVVFLPSAILVGSLAVAPGEGASPGQAPYLATSGQRVVVVPASPDLPTVHTGEAVSIVLPSNTAVPGKIAASGAAAAAPGGSGQSPASSGGSVAAAAPTVFTVLPDRPAATGTGAGIPVQVSLPTQSARGVLAVPVTALLALAGGGYGVEVVTPSGLHRLTAVRTGLFAGGRVAVSGAGVTAGTRVVVAQ